MLIVLFVVCFLDLCVCLDLDCLFIVTVGCVSEVVLYVADFDCLLLMICWLGYSYFILVGLLVCFVLVATFVGFDFRLFLFNFVRCLVWRFDCFVCFVVVLLGCLLLEILVYDDLLF